MGDWLMTATVAGNALWTGIILRQWCIRRNPNRQKERQAYLLTANMLRMSLLLETHPLGRFRLRVLIAYLHLRAFLK